MGGNGLVWEGVWVFGWMICRCVLECRLGVWGERVFGKWEHFVGFDIWEWVGLNEGLWGGNRGSGEREGVLVKDLLDEGQRKRRMVGGV